MNRYEFFLSLFTYELQADVDGESGSVEPRCVTRSETTRNRFHTRSSILFPCPLYSTHPPLFLQLKPGYLEVLSPDGTRREILETSTTLVDRGFIRGDLVRPARPRNTPPSAQKSQSGTIISISSRVQLQRVLAPSETNENWYETSDLVAAARVNRGDHVVSGDWVGIVEEVFEMALIETSNGGLRRVCDVGSNLSVGPVSEVS